MNATQRWYALKEQGRLEHRRPQLTAAKRKRIAELLDQKIGVYGIVARLPVTEALVRRVKAEREAK
jgi:hypothetical protein